MRTSRRFSPFIRPLLPPSRWCNKFITRDHLFVWWGLEWLNRRPEASGKLREALFFLIFFFCNVHLPELRGRVVGRYVPLCAAASWTIWGSRPFQRERRLIETENNGVYRKRWLILSFFFFYYFFFCASTECKKKVIKLQQRRTIHQLSPTNSDRAAVMIRYEYDDDYLYYYWMLACVHNGRTAAGRGHVEHTATATKARKKLIKIKQRHIE